MGYLAQVMRTLSLKAPGPSLRRAILLSLSACALAAPASAALYKWTDANGRVVYSDQPPTGNVKVETVAGASPPANPNAARELATKEAEFKKRQADAAEKEKKTESQRAEFAKRAEQCQRAQGQIRQLSNENIGLVRYNDKGEAVVVDDTQRRKDRADAEAWFKQNCVTASN